MKFDVRNSGGMKLGRINVTDINFLRHPPVRYCRALRPKFYGAGFHLLSFRETDPSYATIDFDVSEWMSRPTIGASGGYYPGRVDFVLIYDGPLEMLRDVPAFEVTCHD